MNTFFAQVRINQADDDLRDLPLKLWLGSNFDEHTEFEEFADRLETEGYELETRIRIQLRRDKLIGAEPLPAESLRQDGWEKV